MRKHFFPNRPVMGPVGADIQPVTNIFPVQYTTELFVGFPAAVPFCGAQHNAHLPEGRIVRRSCIIYRVIEIDIIIIVSVHEGPDIEHTAHGETIAGDGGMPESEVDGVVSAKAAAGNSDAVMTRFFPGPGYDFFQDQSVIKGVVVCPFRRGDRFVIPAERIQAVGAVYFHFPVLEEPAGGFNQSLVFILVVGTLRSREKDQWVAGMTEYEHFKLPADNGGMPFVIFFPYIHITKLLKKTQIAIGQCCPDIVH